MKTTQIRRIMPVLGVSSLGGGGGEISGGNVDSGLFPPSGTIPTANGSNQWAWGSNVAIITSNSSNQLTGPFVNFQSGVGIAFAAASNTLTITNTGVPGPPGGGAASDPTIPSGGTLYDGTSTSGWTTFGASLTFDVTTFTGHFYLQKTTMGAGEIVGVHRAISSLPRTITVKFTDWINWTDFAAVSVHVGEATPGKYVSWAAIKDGVSKYMQRSLWTNATTNAGQTNFPATSDFHHGPPIWLRLVINSSTDIEGWVSRQGYVYQRLFSAYNPSFTVGVFGFSIQTFSAIEMKAVIDWIHET